MLLSFTSVIPKSCHRIQNHAYVDTYPNIARRCRSSRLTRWWTRKRRAEEEEEERHKGMKGSLTKKPYRIVYRRTKWKKQNPGMDVNCGTLPSPPGGPCPFPYPSLFPPSPSEVGFYGAAVAAAQAGFPFFASGGGHHHPGGPPVSMADIPVSGGPSATTNLVRRRPGFESRSESGLFACLHCRGRFLNQFHAQSLHWIH
jgi:hypothetical protein